MPSDGHGRAVDRAALAHKDAVCFLRSFDTSRSASTATGVFILKTVSALNQLSENRVHLNRLQQIGPKSDGGRHGITE